LQAGVPERRAPDVLPPPDADEHHRDEPEDVAPSLALPGEPPELRVERAHICGAADQLGRGDRRWPAEGRPLLALLLEQLLQRFEIVGGRGEEVADLVVVVRRRMRVRGYLHIRSRQIIHWRVAA